MSIFRSTFVILVKQINAIQDGTLARFPSLKIVQQLLLPCIDWDSSSQLTNDRSLSRARVNPGARKRNQASCYIFLLDTFDGNGVSLGRVARIGRKSFQPKAARILWDEESWSYRAYNALILQLSPSEYAVYTPIVARLLETQISAKDSELVARKEFQNLMQEEWNIAEDQLQGVRHTQLISCQVLIY